MSASGDKFEQYLNELNDTIDFYMWIASTT